MVFRQVGNDTDKLINKFGILNKSFANIKKDFQNGQGLRSFGNIVSKQDLVNFEKFQQDLQRGISYHKAFNNNLANSHTYIQQQAVRLRELNIQQKLLGRQLKTNKISQEEYNASMTANKAQITALTTKTQALTLAQKASAAASKAAVIALNMLSSVAIMVVINLIITGINKIVNQMKDLKEEIDNLKSEFDDTKSKIEDINSALDENKKKIEEINQNPLDITNKETLATLQLENAELERQNKLLEEIEKQKSKELDKKTAEYLNKNSEFNMDNGYFSAVWNNIIQRIKPSFMGGKGYIDDFQQIFDQDTTWLEKAGTVLKYNPIFSTVANLADILTPETRSVLEETESFTQELQKNVDEITKILGTGQDIDYKAFSGLMSNVDELRSKLSGNIDILLEYRGSLNTTSDEYKAITGYIEDYTAQLAKLEEFDGYNLDGFTDNYFKIKDEFDKGLNGYLTSIADNQNIDKSISELLGTKFDEKGKQFYALTGNYMEQYKQAEKLLNTIDTIELDRNLTYDESIIKSSVQNFYNNLSKEIDKYGEDFLNGKSSEASNLFKNYVNSYPIEDITKETYSQWRDGLLQQAQGDTAIEDVLNRMVNGISLDISKIIENKPFETTTQSLTELKTAIDNTFSNQSIIQSAFDKIQEGSSLSADEVRKLIELYPQLATEFVKTADGYTIGADKLINANDKIVQSTKQSLQERADYLKEFINTDYDTSGIDSSYEAKKYNEWQQSVKSAKTELEGLELVLSMFGITLEDTGDKLEDLSKTASKKVKLITTAMEEMNDTGYISSSTYAEIVEMGGNFADCLEIQNGKLKLNVQKLKDLERQENLNAIAAKNLAISELQAAAAMAAQSHDAEKVEEIRKQITALEEERAVFWQINDEIANAKPEESGSGGSSSSSDPWKEQFDKEYSEKQHLLAMEQLSEEDYLDWLDGAYKQYFSDLTKYQDEYYKYEEEVYKGRKQLAEDYFDEQQKLFEDRVSNLETQIEITTKTSESSDGTKLNTKEKYDDIRSGYQEIINIIEERIDEIVQAGVEGHEDLLAELEKQLEEYKEKLDNVFKDAVEEEKDYIEKQKDAFSDAYDERIDKIKEEKEAAEEAAQAEIDAIQEKINTLEKANKKAEEANDIEKARQELEKAKNQRTIATVSANGTISYQADPEAVQKAQEELDNALFEQQINLLEDQKDVLEATKKKQSEAYDDIIENLTSQKEDGERQFDILLKVLDDYLNPDTSTSNIDVWSTLAKTEGVKLGKNGQWVDKDGKVIDIEKLMKSSQTKTDAEKNAGNNSNDNKDNTNATKLGRIERKQLGSENETELNTESKTESALDKLFANWEKMFNLEKGSLTLEKVQQVLINSPTMKYNPYGAMNERMNRVYRNEYVSNVNNNNSDSNVTFSGDININNPVANSYDLAEDIVKNLPNAVAKQIHKKNQ